MFLDLPHISRSSSKSLLWISFQQLKNQYNRMKIHFFFLRERGNDKVVSSLSQEKEVNFQRTLLNNCFDSSEKNEGNVSGSVKILSFISSGSSEKNGGRPESISYNNVPKAHQSTVLSYPFPRNTSGATTVNDHTKFRT